MTEETRGVEELQQVLAAEAELIRHLVALTEQERAALQMDNLVDLAAITREKEAVLHRLAEREGVREQIVGRLVELLKLSPDVSLPELLFHLDQLTGFPARLKAEVADLHQAVVTSMEQLLTLGYGNRSILETGLARVNATFDYLAAVIAPPEAGAYTAKGQNQAKPEAAAGHMLNWQI